MVDEAATLPEDPGSLRELVISLRGMVRERSAERDLAYAALKFKTLELEKLRMQLAQLRRKQFGQSSEKLSREVAQLELAIEEIEAGEAVVMPAAAAGASLFLGAMCVLAIQAVHAVPPSRPSATRRR